MMRRKLRLFHTQNTDHILSAANHHLTSQQQLESWTPPWPIAIEMTSRGMIGICTAKEAPRDMRNVSKEANFRGS